MKSLTTLVRFATAAGLLLFPVALISGCEESNEVLDVETPEGELEVEENPNTGDVDVEVDQ